MKKGNISVFIPHVGCPHKCSFCNQNEITGCNDIPGEDDVKRAVETSVAKSGRGVCELAFFGGSFTAVDRDYMLSLLKAAEPYIKNGDIIGIRCSTRPDAISDEILEILKQYGVTSIELGAQSMNDEVLQLNLRGHTSDDVRKASSLIRKYGFELGLQMMTDLYGSTFKEDIETGKALIGLKPKTMRIYPTVILKGTYLEKLYKEGRYCPADISDRVSVAAKLVTMFRENGIEVIRVGLHSGGDVKENAIGNTFCDAIGEMVDSQILFNRITTEYLPGEYDVHINCRDISKLVGQRRENINKLNELGYKLNMVADDLVKIDDLELVKV